jgi:hypothetical protein
MLSFVKLPHPPFLILKSFSPTDQLSAELKTLVNNKFYPRAVKISETNDFKGTVSRDGLSSETIGV